LLLPVGTKQNLLGILSLGPKLSEEPYSSSDVQLLRSVAAQTGLALENSRLTKAVASEMAQRERLNREIEIAREVQERLFPQRLPVMAGIDFCGACRPALGVGGDYYDFLELPNGDLGVAVGDVSGKGIAAALLMASLQASLRGQVLSGQGNLARLMTNVNQLVYEATPANRYATFFYGQFERATLTFR
jgi:sigma-B regulation protein RsbU (phosphoserine phosphatase)